MRNLKEQDIKERLLKNDTLFRDVHIIKQKFDILPEDKEHYGVSIAFQDIQELREDFINDLLDTIVDWVYSSEKYKELRDKEIKNGKTEAILRESRNARRNAEVECRNSADDRRIVRNAETQSVFTAEQRRLEEQKRLDEKERARAARKRNKRRSGPEL